MAKPIIKVPVTHAINCSIRENRFPSLLKISRVLPIQKPKKSKLEKESYRPVCNLHSLEKLFEEHIKVQLVEYLETNEILHDGHHGGRKNRSTMTAKASIDDNLAKKYEEGKTTSIISTDLSLCFDTVDHKTLLEKMNFYGIQGKENTFFESFLSERTQYIELETCKSTVRNANNCSVI